MGLLDTLFPSSDGGGLLDLLKRNANLAPADTGLPSDQPNYGAPPIGPQSIAPQAIPQNPPAVIPAQPMPQQAQQPQQPIIPTPPAASGSPGFMTGYENLHGGGGLLGSIMAGITGQRNDPQGVALQQQAQVANVTAQALIDKGIPRSVAIAAVQPGNSEVLKTLVTQAFGPQTVTPLGEGYVADRNGKVSRAYEPEDKNKIVQIGEDGLGQKQFGVFNPSDGSIKPVGPQGGAVQGLGDTNKSGPEYLATLPKEKQGIVQGMIDGTIQPPSSFALAKPYWQGMLAAAKNADPSFDSNNWATRHKMSTDIAGSGNSSMGGILANGKSAFAHLSDLSGSMADLGNASHDYPGGGAVAATQNYLGNAVLAGSDTKAKIKAINDNLGHYGQESTKFYSGTGGGVEERMNALKEMNPDTTSSEEMASYLAKEKSLMTDRLKQKEAQIRDTMGEAYLQKHPIFTPDLQSTLDTIDTNIAKLKGGTPTAPTPAAAVPDRAAIAAEMKRRGLPVPQ